MVVVRPGGRCRYSSWLIVHTGRTFRFFTRLGQAGPCLMITHYGCVLLQTSSHVQDDGFFAPSIQAFIKVSLSEPGGGFAVEYFVPTDVYVCMLSSSRINDNREGCVCIVRRASTPYDIASHDQVIPHFG
jgi:hypothetical protein